MAWPMGVLGSHSQHSPIQSVARVIWTYVQPYARHINHGLTALAGHLRAAMRAPKARPSNVSVTALSASDLQDIYCRGLGRLTMKHNRDKQDDERPAR